MAIAVLSLTVACKQKAAEEPIDTMPIDTMIEEVIDTTIEEVAEDTVVAEPVKQATKKATKKATKVDPTAKNAPANNNASITLTKTDGTTVTMNGPSTPKAGELSKVGAPNTTKKPPVDDPSKRK